MKKVAVMTGILLALTSSYVSAAPGLDMRWWGADLFASKCPLNAGAPIDASDPCNDNFNVHGFSMAFKAPPGISKLVAETFIVDVQTSAPILPDWWHLEDRNDAQGVPPGCRGGDPNTGQVSSFGFNTTRSSGSTAVCKDYWGINPQAGGTVWQPGTGGPDRTRLFGVFARSTATAGPVTPDVEYWVGTGFFDTNHAVADPSTVPPTLPCAGCQLGACLVFNSLFLQQPAGTPGGDVTITGANLSNYMTWQGGSFNCPGAVPTKKTSWGQVKSLYR